MLYALQFTCFFPHLLKHTRIKVKTYKQQSLRRVKEEQSLRCGPKQNRVRHIETKGKKLRTNGCTLIVSTQSDQQLCRLDN